MSVISKTIKNKLTGVAVAVTSVTLSSYDETYGVKRNDTDGVVVADGTAMTNISTGRYRYEFDDPADDLTYTYVLEIVYAGETYWITGTITGPTSAGGAGVEPGLTLTVADLVAEVGDALAIGRAPTGDDLTMVLGVIDSGYRQFLFPGPLPGEKAAHRWSFLSPVETLDLAGDDYDYDLPARFGTLRGTFTYASGITSTPIRICGEAHIRALKAAHTRTGDPYLAATRIKTYAEGTGTRFEVVFFPTPSQVRTLTYAYDVLLDKLSENYVAGGSDIYPLGGAKHSETLLECCLGVAEQRRDDMMGIHTARIMDRDGSPTGLMEASVLADRANAPDYLGYNADGSDAPEYHGRDITEWQYNGLDVS